MSRVDKNKKKKVKRIPEDINQENEMEKTKKYKGNSCRR